MESPHLWFSIMAPNRARIAPRCVAQCGFDSYGIEPVLNDSCLGAIKGSFWVLFLRFSQNSGFRKPLSHQALSILTSRRCVSPPPPFLPALQKL